MIDFTNPLVLIIGSVLVLIILGALRSKSSGEKKKNYDSDFISETEILSRWNKGFCLTGVRALTKKASFSNCSVFGASGSGKSSTIIVPSAFSLARGESSICFNDPSGEVYQKVSGYLKKVGYQIRRIDFSRPEQSDCFNPLLRCKTVSEIKQVSNLIIRNTIGDSKGDPFWDRSSEMLITMMSRFLVYHSEPEYRTMTNVLRLIETFATFPKRLDHLFVATHDEELLNSYRATIVSGDKTLQSIVATARAALNIFSDPTVIQTTSRDTIDFGLLRKEKVALFITNPIQHIAYYKPLAALFFESLFNEVLSRIPDGKSQHCIYMLLDEAATMKFSALSTTISNIRKYNAGIMLVVQDYQQLVALYGPAEAHNIRTNTYAQVYLKGQPLETCKELETTLGRFTYTDERGMEKNRLLMSADEIRKSEEAIILCGNLSPIKAKMKPYYERWILRKRTSLPAYQQPVAAQSGMPPLIQFGHVEA